MSKTEARIMAERIVNEMTNDRPNNSTDALQSLVSDLMQHDTLLATAEAIAVAMLSIRTASGKTGVPLGRNFEDHLECCLQVAEMLRGEYRKADRD